MHRRLFLQFPHVASALLAKAETPNENQTLQKGFKVEGFQRRIAHL